MLKIQMHISKNKRNNINSERRIDGRMRDIHTLYFR